MTEPQARHQRTTRRNWSHQNRSFNQLQAVPDRRNSNDEAFRQQLSQVSPILSEWSLVLMASSMSPSTGNKARNLLHWLEQEEKVNQSAMKLSSIASEGSFAVPVPRELYEAVSKQTNDINDYVENALRHELERHGLYELLRTLNEELGEPDEDLLLEARQAFDDIDRH